jgi:hypothetical protein
LVKDASSEYSHSEERKCKCKMIPVETIPEESKPSLREECGTANTLSLLLWRTAEKEVMFPLVLQQQIMCQRK